MPPVILFNKEWRLGSDDFVFSSLLEILCRIGSFVTLGFILGFHMQELNQLECMGKEYRYTTGYLICALVLQIFCTINLCGLGYYSAQGQIFDTSVPHPRKHVSTHLYINCMLTLTEVVITGCGTFFVIKDWIRCGTEDKFRIVIIFILLIIILTYILLAIKLICVITAFKPFSKKISGDEREPLSKKERMKKESVWTYRGLRCLMPWSNDEGTLEAFKEISNMLSATFHDDNMVPSDIAAGLLLLHYNHSKEKEQKENPSNIEPVIHKNAEISEDISDLKYYYKYSLAAYGCWWYVLDNPVCRLCSLTGYLHYCPCFPCMRDQRQIVEGDGCCNMNLAAAKAQLNGNDEDFIIFDNRNKIQEVPYFVAVDHEKKCLVISIRGTMSISDMFTDLRAESCPLNTGFPDDISLDANLKGHKGMVHAARYVYLRLHGLPASEAEKNKERKDRVNILNLALAEFPDYSLVVTGHSLGAGTAAILSFILREKYKDRDVKCYAFSPPGGLLSPGAAEESLKFTVTLVTGDDVIPRLSLINIAKLSDEIRKVAEQCRLPKYKLFGYGLVSFLCCVKSATIEEELCRMSQETRNSEDQEKYSFDVISTDLEKKMLPRKSLPEQDLIILNSPSGNPTSTSSHGNEAVLVEVEPMPEDERSRQALQQQVAAGCETLKESADEFNKIERVCNHKEDEMSMTLVEVNNSQTQESESVSVLMKSCQEVRSNVGGNDDNLVGEQLLSSATDQILTISTMEGSTMYPPGRIVYLEETEEGKCEIFRPDKSHFKKILVSPRMLRDHLPNHLDRLISKL